jgi:hypothetical protein
MIAKPVDEDGFTPPGAIELSRSAWQLARAFDETVKGMSKDWIVTFGWGDSISLKSGPDEPYRDIGGCLTLGAYKRREVPPGFVQTVEGLEFVIQIPRKVWEGSSRRVIDVDETLPFKLALR